MKTEDFAQKVIGKFSEELTDFIFLYIENDKDLMHDYLRLVSENNLNTVNRALGKKIKEKFNVENKERKGSTKSKLIQSYTQHTSPS